MLRSRCPTSRAFRSEEVAQLEMQLEARRRPAEGVGAIEPVGPVDADRTERRDDADPDPRAAEQAGRVELLGAGPHVARVDEGREVEHLRDARPDFAGRREVRLAERARARLPVARGGIEPAWRDRELVVAAEWDAVLYTTHGEQLIEEGRVAEHESGP